MHQTPDTAGDSDLTAIVAAWPNLPAAIRAGIVAMVEASTDKGVTPTRTP